MDYLVLHPDHNIHKKVGENLFNSKDFDSFSKLQVQAYNEYINNLCEEYGDKAIWWASSLSSRNIFFSSFFLNWCYVYYALEIAKKNRLKYILCENKKVKNILKSMDEFKQVEVNVAPAATKSTLKEFYFLKILYFSLRFISNNFKKYSAAKKSKKSSKKYSLKPLELVDIFVTNNAFDNDTFNDQYFGDFVLEQKEKNWCYLPQLFQIKDLKNCFQQMRKNKIPFLIKEDYLKITDYIWVIINSIKLYFIPFSTTTKHPMNQLVRYDILSRFNSDNMDFLLLYLLPKRLKEQKVPINSLLDWHEAQPLDNILNFSFKKYYINIKLAHYVGAFFSFYQGISYQAISAQVNKGILGTKFFFQGKGIVDNFINIPGITYSIAPAFRIKTSSRSIKKPSDHIAVILPNMLEQSVEMIDFISDSNLEQDDLYISIHPRTDQNFIKQYIQKTISTKFKVRYIENLAKEINHFKLIVSTGTTAFVEAYQYAIPCIVVASRSKHTLNFIPDEYLHDLFELSFDPSTLSELISKLTNYKSSNFENFSKKYIHPTNKINNTQFKNELFK